MRCDEARLAISLALDGELGAEDGDGPVDGRDALEDHVRHCTGCAAFRRHALQVRSQLRFEGVDQDSLPDVVPAILATIRDEHTDPATTRDHDRDPAGDGHRRLAAVADGGDASDVGPAGAAYERTELAVDRGVGYPRLATAGDGGDAGEGESTSAGDERTSPAADPDGGAADGDELAGAGHDRIGLAAHRDDKGDSDGVGDESPELAVADDASAGPAAVGWAGRTLRRSSPSRGRRGAGVRRGRASRSASPGGWRIAAAVAAGFVLGAAIVGLSGATDDGRDVPTNFAGQATDLEEPGQVLLAWTPEELDPAVEEAARETPQVTAVSVVASGVSDLVASHDATGRAVDAPAPGWAIPLDTIAVDPVAHARFAPLADQSAVAGLGDGEALLGRSSAELRGLGVGSTIELAGGQRLSVVGVVDDAAVGAAELAVTSETGREIGVDHHRYMLLAHVGTRGPLERSLRRAAGDVPIRFRQPGETAYLRHGDAVLPPVLLKQRFGEFAYQPPPPGQREFEQDPAWQADHIVERDVPLIGRMRCHEAVLDAIEGALRELEARGLGHLIDPAGYQGCWNPRLVRSGGDLSHHAWGVAFDINYHPDTDGPAAEQDPHLVEVFRRWGFAWGGEWLVDDPAHFEHVRTPPPPATQPLSRQ